MEYIFYKKNKSDKVWWVEHQDVLGELLVSFDKIEILNLWTDYPHKFTKEQKKQFDLENPFWRDFFA